MTSLHSLPDPTATGRSAANDSTALLPLALLDEIGWGLIVCDGNGRIHFANQAACAELHSGLLLLARDGSLRRVAGGSAEIETALAHAALRGRRSLVRLGSGDDRLLVGVVPFQMPSTGTTLALVMLGHRQPCSGLALEMLAGSYGLTLAERRVLALLLEKAAPREIAQQLGVKLSTVRTQITAIRSKLGVRSIDELLLRSAEMPPVTTALRLSTSPATNGWLRAAA